MPSSDPETKSPLPYDDSGLGYSSVDMKSLLKKGAKLTPEYNDPPAESKWNWNKTVKYGAVAVGVGATVGGIVAVNHYTSNANYYNVTDYKQSPNNVTKRTFEAFEGRANAELVKRALSDHDLYKLVKC
jgi:hypothetical protein